MDAAEYARKNAPKGQHSVLVPYADGIATLHAQHYALRQIQEWLAHNGVRISRQAVHKFIKKRSAAAPHRARSSETTP